MPMMSLKVLARTEGFARTLDHHGAHLGIFTGFPEERRGAHGSFFVEGIESVGPVEREISNGVPHLV